MKTTLIDLIRHGEPEGGQRYRGQTDDPLSAKGWKQMWEAVGGACHWRRIVSSPLQRCAAFAGALGERWDLPVFEDPRLMEVRFGVWEGHTAHELESASPGVLRRFYQDPVANRPEGAESLEDFTARVGHAWEDWSTRYPGEPLLVVCHAGVIRAVVREVLGIPLAHLYRIQVANAAVTRIRVQESRPPTVVFHGAERVPSPGSHSD